MMKKICIFAILAVLAGCEKEPDMSMDKIDPDTLFEPTLVGPNGPVEREAGDGR